MRFTTIKLFKKKRVQYFVSDDTNIVYKIHARINEVIKRKNAFLFHSRWFAFKSIIIIGIYAYTVQSKTARSVGSLSTHFKRHSLNILHASTSFLFFTSLCFFWFAQFAEFVPFDRIQNSKSSYSQTTTLDCTKPFRCNFSNKISVDFALDSMYLFVSLFVLRWRRYTICFNIEQENFISLNASYLKKKICEGNSSREMIHIITNILWLVFILSWKRRKRERERKCIHKWFIKLLKFFMLIDEEQGQFWFFFKCCSSEKHITTSRGNDMYKSNVSYGYHDRM